MFDIFELGKTAYEKGEGLDSNPFAKDDERYLAWFAGYTNDSKTTFKHCFDMGYGEMSVARLMRDSINKLFGCLPANQSEFMIKHNGHLSYYEDIETYEKNPKTKCVNHDSRQKSIDSNNVWIASWKSKSENRFCRIGAHSLMALFKELAGDKFTSELEYAVSFFKKILPVHDCSLFIEVNPHTTSGESVPEWNEDEQPVWRDNTSLVKAVESDEVCSLKWYPSTPGGFCHVASPTLEALCNWLIEDFTVDAAKLDSGCKHIVSQILKVIEEVDINNNFFTSNYYEESIAGYYSYMTISNRISSDRIALKTMCRWGSNEQQNGISKQNSKPELITFCFDTQIVRQNNTEMSFSNLSKDFNLLKTDGEWSLVDSDKSSFHSFLICLKAWLNGDWENS